MNVYKHNPPCKFQYLDIDIKSFLPVIYEISTRYQQNVDILWFVWIFPHISWKNCVNYGLHLCKSCRASQNPSTKFPRNVSKHIIASIYNRKTVCGNQSMIYCKCRYYNTMKLREML